MHIIGYISHRGVFQALELQSAEKAAVLIAALESSGNPCCYYSLNGLNYPISSSEVGKILQRMRVHLPNTRLSKLSLEEGINLLQAEKAVIEATTDYWSLDLYGNREE